MIAKHYLGRLAPSPTGLLHLGHARTFLHAAARARGGKLYLRIEDIDPLRCRPQFTEAILRDLSWLGLIWEGEPLFQSQRLALYRNALTVLAGKGLVYPCHHSRSEIAAAAQQVEPGDKRPLFPVALRPAAFACQHTDIRWDINWRFRVPDGRCISFKDEIKGRCDYKAGEVFGDFLVWRKDGWPSYELAVVVDDIAQRITEVVRGGDLLTSTARQLLVYEALGSPAPAFAHLPLVVDESGQRLSKTFASVALDTLRERGIHAGAIREWASLPVRPGDCINIPHAWQANTD